MALLYDIWPPSRPRPMVGFCPAVSAGVQSMPAHLLRWLLVGVALSATSVVRSQAGVADPDLSGYWSNATVTPLERPTELGDKSHFTAEEAAEWERTFFDR